VGIVNDAVRDAVGESWFANHLVPLRRRQLAGDQDGGVLVQILDKFH
jgi:hypothetical protein